MSFNSGPKPFRTVFAEIERSYGSPSEQACRIDPPRNSPASSAVRKRSDLIGAHWAQEKFRKKLRTKILSEKKFL
jgi:hypothetical protein